MTLTVNGQKRELSEGASVADLLRDLGLAQTPCAAEVNRELVPRREHARRELHEGDVIELVTLVGGG